MCGVKACHVVYPQIIAVFYGKSAKLFKLHRNQGFRLPMSDVTIQFRITSRVVELLKFLDTSVNICNVNGYSGLLRRFQETCTG